MSLLIKPIITEKATNDSELNNCYTFQVSKSANKVEIKKAIEASYGVKVDKVRGQELDVRHILLRPEVSNEALMEAKKQIAVGLLTVDYNENL